MPCPRAAPPLRRAECRTPPKAQPGRTREAQPATAGKLEAECALDAEHYRNLERRPEEDFDAVARFAAALCAAPFACVTVVDGKREWCKARAGALPDEPEVGSFCARAREAPGDVLVVEDARFEPRFASEPILTGEPFIRFYAGIPILSRAGFPIATVSVLDAKVRGLSATECEVLKTLARQAAALFELRCSTLELAQHREAAVNYRLADEKSSTLALFVRRSDSSIVGANAGAARAYGYTRKALCDLNLSDVRVPEPQPTGDALAALAPGTVRETLHRRSDGSSFPVKVASVATIFEGQPVDMLILHDISERKAREDDNARYRLLSEGARDIMLFVRYRDRRILEANAAACPAYGYTPEEMRALLLTDLRVGSAADLDAILTAVEGGRGVGEAVHRRKDGSTFPAEVTATITQVGGEAVLFAIVRDIGERVKREAATLARERELQASNAALVEEIADRKAAETRLEHAAFHDGLTGLPNRALLMDRLKYMVARLQRRSDHLSAILVLDIDRFKSINDSLGHVVGDLVLIAIARRLERCLRVGDTFARLGGDEFSILLDGIDGEAEATRFAERILRELKPPFYIPSHGDVFVSASIGLVVSNTGHDLPDDLLRSADVAMYQAKAEGKQRCQLFRSELLTRAAGVLALETDLNLALERHEFRLAYQPIVWLHDGTISGFEALLRWQHPQRGIVGPGDFVAAAEGTGIILPIGEWVLGEACRQVRVWHATFPSQQHLTVNVNVSAKQVSSASFLAYLRETLGRHSVCVRNLQLEITETALMTDSAASTELLKELRTLGIPVHLDDFGTGYSSLAYLHRFPVDTLKIDRSFVSGAGNGLANPEIVQAVIALAKSLSIETIAEGIETREQYEGLLALGCESGQGFYFSRPLDVAGASAAIAGGAMLMPVVPGRG